MGDNATLHNVRFTFRQRVAIRAISHDALSYVDKRYGTGYPKNIPGEITISHFHNGLHTRSVGNSAHAVAKAIGLNDAECSIARLAGFAHDIGQSFPETRGYDEAKSAQWLALRINSHRVLPAAIEPITTLAIKGTEPLFDKNLKISGQMAGELEYPSRSAEQIAKCVACGDFGIFYQPLGPYCSHTLYNEFQRCVGDPPMDSRLVRFQRRQIALAETLTYILPEAESVLATHKREVIAYAKKVLTQLERGEIETWSQLLAQDLQFARKYQ